jgi:hypothetical protein
MSETFPNHTNIFRVVMEDEHGTLFQWRGPYTTAAEAERVLDDADKDHPEAGAPWVQELMKNDEGETAQWEDVK